MKHWLFGPRFSQVSMLGMALITLSFTHEHFALGILLSVITVLVERFVLPLITKLN